MIVICIGLRARVILHGLTVRNIPSISMDVTVLPVKPAKRKRMPEREWWFPVYLKYVMIGRSLAGVRNTTMKRPELL